MNRWLFKTEPSTYSFGDLQKDSVTAWDGVRNYQARNNLKRAKKGDTVFIYHSGEEKAVMGLAEVVREAYPDPADKGDWVAVDVRAVSGAKKPVSLAQIKADPALKRMALVRQSRLSVAPVTAAEARRILALAA